MIPLTGKYRPKTLDGFVGLEGPRKILGKLAADPWESAWLLVGDSGTGKTTSALAVQAAIGGQLHHIPSRKCDMATVEKVIHDCYYIPMGGGWPQPWRSKMSKSTISTFQYNSQPKAEGAKAIDQ